jgi:hypothetical protein
VTVTADPEVDADAIADALGHYALTWHIKER